MFSLKMSVKNSASNLDHILENYVGGVGRYQILVLIVLNHLQFNAYFYHVYTAYAPDHRCRVAICEAQNQSKVYIKCEVKCLYQHE